MRHLTCVGEIGKNVFLELSERDDLLVVTRFL